MKVVVVIPTYNECQNIGQLIKEIFDLPLQDISLVIIDDNSPDETGSIVAQHAKEKPIYLISRTKKMGLGSAYVKGFKMALKKQADYIIQMDADLSHDPTDIIPLLNACQDVDMAIGSRKIDGGSIVGWGIVRKTMSGGAMIISRILLGLKTKDITSGYRCFKASTIKHINSEKIASSGYAFQEEVLFRIEKNGFSIKEIPVCFHDRKKGKSKLSKKDIFEFFTIIWSLKKKNKEPIKENTTL